MKKFGICFDTETTGLLAPKAADIIHQPFITEIFACKFDIETFEVIEEFETLINVPLKLKDEIVRITGITNEMLKDYKEFDFFAPQISNFFEGAEKIVAHNLMFDLEVLSRNYTRYKLDEIFPEIKEKVCTVEMSYPMFNKRLKLGQLYEIATGEELKNAHRARNDVLANLKCYEWLISEGF